MKRDFEAIVIGASAGGLHALTTIFETLPADFKTPIIVVQHRAKDEKGLLEEVLQNKCKLKIRQADDKEKIKGGNIYIAPPDYHLLIESDRTFSLSYDPLVNYSRPSIDVLFESASEIFKSKLLAIILTGANNDGAAGIEKIKKLGGFTIAQNPETALFPSMPRAAIKTGSIRHVLDLEEIRYFLITINELIPNGR